MFGKHSRSKGELFSWFSSLWNYIPFWVTEWIAGLSLVTASTVSNVKYLLRASAASCCVHFVNLTVIV